MMRTAWKPVIVIASLLLLLTYLLLQSRSPDLALRGRIHETLRAFELHDAELTRDVLLARAGLLANYDSLERTGQNLARDVEALRNDSLTASDPAARALLVEHAAALAEAASAKVTTVEYFKSDNALLRNSLIYLTHAQAALRAKVATERAVAEEMGRLSHSLLQFMQTPEVSVGRDIQTVLDRLSKITSSDQEFQIMVMHGRFIVDKLPQADALLQQIITSSTATHARALQAALLQYSGRIEGRAQLFRFMLYLVAVTLLGYLSYQFLRLRTTASELRATNARLNREIGERQQVEAALRASEERLRAMTDSAKEAIVSADSAGDIVSWNSGATAIFGYEPREILRTPFTRLLPQRDQAAHTQSLAEWVTIGHSSLFDGTTNFTGRNKDGREFPLEVSLSTWSTQQGNHLTYIMRDITERRRLEETAQQQQLQLIQANKMTALGTLVSGVAHEINNPNQLVLLNSRVLGEAWDDALAILDDYHDRNGDFTLGGLPYSEMRQTIFTLVRDVHDGALRIERIVNDLKDFARPRAHGAHAVFDLNDAVQRALRLLAHLIRKRTAHCRVDLAPNLPPLRGDAQQVEQIVVNLLVNALEALPNRESAVGVSTTFHAAENCAVLDVTDAGIGIPREHLPRLCDPFFTTKQDSGGTGLGLAITASLVRAHGAKLDFQSESGRGTRAVVTLPFFANKASTTSVILAT
jgi:PAS domain S-box-containing protein